MRICLITTFFGQQSFGGDATYVDHLSRALLRLRHEVHVVHCADAFDAVRNGTPLRSYEPPPGLNLHRLTSPLGVLSPIWTHQIGGPGPKWPSIRRILQSAPFDVVHLHNLSLIGGPRLIRLIRSLCPRSVLLMTSHEHWLLCPLSLRFRPDRTICHGGRCMLCSIRARRPPQLWRLSRMMRRNLRLLDGLVFPSSHALEANKGCGADSDAMVTIPYFLPENWAHRQDSAARNGARQGAERPYFAAVGRLVPEKGIDTLIPLMRRMPDIDLRIAGAGPEADALEGLARDVPNVVFEGPLGFHRLAELYRGARAVVVPSRFFETFGYVVLEAFSTGTPAIVRNVGALPEVVASADGGIICDDDAAILEAMKLLTTDEARGRELGRNGARAAGELWSEAVHMRTYLGLIETLRRRPAPGPVAEPV